jgi:nucleoside-diphosphate-sugar epimerase
MLPNRANGNPEATNFIIKPEDPILITGSTGFVGPSVLAALLARGFSNLICFARPSSDLARLGSLGNPSEMRARVHVIKGNLLSREDCAAATRDVALIFHLATGGGDKSFPDAFMNSVVTTRNLLEASATQHSLQRFVNVSSLAVYANRTTPSRLLDESGAIEDRPDLRGDAYCFAKIKQDEIVTEYCNKAGIPYVIVRPGYVYGPGRPSISSRVGIDTFGVFLHLGGANAIPLTYIDNCADAIVLAGLKSGIDGEVFNIVDDDLPTSRKLLRLYKKNKRSFRSVYVPHGASYALCYLWERYSAWSEGQLPPVFNRRRWYAYWKKTKYCNHKLKVRAGWTPKTTTADALRHYFESCGSREQHA